MQTEQTLHAFACRGLQPLRCQQSLRGVKGGKLRARDRLPGKAPLGEQLGGSPFARGFIEFALRK
jgi:hypothetical protein